MGLPVVTVASGGLPVGDNTAKGVGMAVTEATYGIPVTKVASGGLGVVYVSATGGPALTPTAFDVASASNVTLSIGNLKVTRTNLSIGGARSIAYKSSGKYYFEVTIGAAHATTDSIAVMAASYSYSNAANGGPGAGTTYYPVDGTINYSGGFTSKNIGVASSGDIIAIAVDPAGGMSWWRRNNGLWNNTAGADPASGSGSVAAPTNSAPAIVFSSFGSPVVGDNSTANFGASTFSGAVPSGFTAGWPV